MTVLLQEVFSFHCISFNRQSDMTNTEREDGKKRVQLEEQKAMPCGAALGNKVTHGTFISSYDSF